jgi:hypothetical protein
MGLRRLATMSCIKMNSSLASRSRRRAVNLSSMLKLQIRSEDLLRGLLKVNDPELQDTLRISSANDISGQVRLVNGERNKRMRLKHLGYFWGKVKGYWGKAEEERG